MVDRTDEIEEELDASVGDLDAGGNEEFQDPEASAAIDEAQSVVEDLDGIAGGVEGGKATEASGDAGSGTAEESGGSLSLPSLSLPSPSLPSPSVDSLFSLRAFVVALVGIAAGLFLGGTFVPFVDELGGLVGVFLVTFLLGLGFDDPPYLESGLAAALLGGGTAVLANLLQSMASGSVTTLALIGGGVGLVLALLGVYLGRDLRKGLFGDLGGSGGGDPGEDPPEF